MLRRLVVPALAGAVALVVGFILVPAMGVLPRLGLAVAAYLAVASLLPLTGRSPLRTPLATWGMVVAHFGVAVALAGMASNAAFTRETLAVARQGETVAVGPWLVRFIDVVPTAGANFSAIEAELGASRGEGLVTLKPQTRYFANPPAETNEAAIATFWNGQLYTVVGKADPAGGWQLRLWWKPFVTLIWLGGGLVALGGLLALVGRAWRSRRRREPREWRRAYT